MQSAANPPCMKGMDVVCGAFELHCIMQRVVTVISPFTGSIFNQEAIWQLLSYSSKWLITDLKA